MADTSDRKPLPYHDACHAMQSGVAYELERDPSSATPKHLRVGVNSALVNDAALVRVLIAKGVITEAEYAAAITEEMNAEVRRYEDRLSRSYGASITLR